ncbi:MAG: MMPL family transporter [Acidobacteria bacterium]|nr:MMPL family transporter [Acidobacteriota bacterium]
MIRRLLAGAARLGCRRPWLVIGAGLILLVAAGPAVRGLQLDTDASGVIPMDDPELQAYLSGRESFGELSPLMIVLRYPPEAREAVDEITERLHATLSTWPSIESVLSRKLELTESDEAALRLRAALLNSDPPRLDDLVGRVAPDGLEHTLRRSRRRLILAREPETRRMIAADPLDLASLVRPFFAARSGLRLNPTSAYLESADRSARLIVLRPRISAEDSPASSELVRRIREAVAAAVAAAGVPSVEAGLTGFHAMTGESAGLLKREMLWITVAACAGLLLLLGLTLRRPRAIVVCFFPLMVSLAAVLLLARALFNPVFFLTIGFAAIVLGLGLDVGLHLSARLPRFCDGRPLAEAIEATLLDCGPPVIVGLISTAVAFGALSLTGNDGLIQFSLLTSIGLLVTLVVTLVLFPALAFVAWHGEGRRPGDPVMGGAFEALFRVAGRRRKTGTLTALVIVCLALPWAMRFKLDMDLANLFPRHLPSYDVGRTAAETLGTTFASTLQVTLHAPTLERALEAQTGLDSELESLVAEGRVALFDSPSSLLTAPSVRRSVGLEAASEVVSERRQAFFATLDRLGFRRDPGLQGYYTLVERAVDPGLSAVGTADDVRRAVHRVAARSDSGWRLRTSVWPAPGGGEAGLLMETASREVTRRLRGLELPTGVEARVVGPVTLNRRTNELIRSDFYRISWISVALVALVVVLFLRNVRDTAAGLLPLAAALVATAGAAVLLRVPFTPTGVTFVAIIVGVGIDDAVHIVSRLRRTPGADIGEVVEEIGPVITLTTLSSAIGFGSLALSSHPVVASIGIVVTVGVLACWLFTLLLVPSVLSAGRRRGRGVTAALVLLGGLVLVPATAGAADSADEVLALLQKRYERMKAVSCNLRQIKTIRQLEGEVHLEGSLVFQKPNLVKLILHGDQELEVINNGQTVWIVDHDLDEVESYTLDELGQEGGRLAGFGLVVLADPGDLRRLFSIVHTEVEGGDQLELRPLPSSGLGVSSVVVEVDRLGRLRHTVVTHANGDRIETTFTRWRRRPTMSTALFRYVP